MTNSKTPYLPFLPCFKKQNTLSQNRELHVICIALEKSKNKNRKLVLSSFTISIVVYFCHVLDLRITDQVLLVLWKISSFLFMGTIMMRNVKEKPVEHPENEKHLPKMQLRNVQATIGVTLQTMDR